MNGNYRVEIDARVFKEIRRIRTEDAERLLAAIDMLETNPRSRKAKKLVDSPGWRIRIGDYRILYEIIDSQRLVRVYRVGNRRDVYRD